MKKPALLTPENQAKFEELRELSSVPNFDGEQFLDVSINISSMVQGTIRFGIDWKCEIGEIDFNDLDAGINAVKGLRKRMRLS